MSMVDKVLADFAADVAVNESATKEEKKDYGYSLDMYRNESSIRVCDEAAQDLFDITVMESLYADEAAVFESLATDIYNTDLVMECVMEATDEVALEAAAEEDPEKKASKMEALKIKAGRVGQAVKSAFHKVIEAIKKFFTETLPNAFGSIGRFIKDHAQAFGQKVKGAKLFNWKKFAKKRDEIVAAAEEVADDAAEAIAKIEAGDVEGAEAIANDLAETVVTESVSEEVAALLEKSKGKKQRNLSKMNVEQHVEEGETTVSGSEVEGEVKKTNQLLARAKTKVQKLITKANSLKDESAGKAAGPLRNITTALSRALSALASIPKTVFGAVKNFIQHVVGKVKAKAADVKAKAEEKKAAKASAKEAK